MTNCPNCGAPITSNVCEYCGTVHVNVDYNTYLDIEDYKRQVTLLQEQEHMKRIYQDAINAMRSYRGTI